MSRVVAMPDDATAAREFRVVALCGSMRFHEEFDRLETELTLAGHVVLRPTALDPATELHAAARERLGRIHRQRIAMADEVLVVDVDGYVGESTRREIDHAHAIGVPVRYLSPDRAATA